MPVYLSQEEVDALDSLALEELQQNGGYLVRPRTSISSVASSVFNRVADTAAPIAQTATSYVTPPLSPADQQMADLEREQAGSQQPTPIPSFQAPWAAAPPPPPTGVAALPPIVARPSNVPYSPASISVNAVAPQIVPQVPQDYTPVPTMDPGNTFQSFPGQRIALPSEQLQQGRGGILGGLQNIGMGALGALDAGFEYVGKPILGVTSGAMGSEPYLDPRTGQMVRPEPTWSDYFDTAGKVFSQNPLDTYQESRRAVTETMANPDYSVFGLSPNASRTLTSVAGNPLTYVPVGTVGNIASKAPAPLRPLMTGRFNPIGGLLEGVGPQRAIPFIAGTALGTELAERTDTPGLSDAAENLIYSGLGGAGALGLSNIARAGTRGAPVMSAVDDAASNVFPRAELPDVERANLAAAHTKMIDAARAEATLRRTGVVASEISAGRSLQAGGIDTGLREAIASGMSPEDAAIAARRSAAVGPLRQTVTAPVELDPGERAALFADLNNRKLNGEISPFEHIASVEAVQKLLNGEGLQPAEIRRVRKLFGDEVADAIADRPLSNSQVLTQKWRALTKGSQPTPELVEATAGLAQASMTERQIALRFMTEMQARIDKGIARQLAKTDAAAAKALDAEATAATKQMGSNAPALWAERYRQLSSFGVEGEPWFAVLPRGESEQLGKLYASSTGRNYDIDIRTDAGRKNVSRWIDELGTSALRQSGREVPLPEFGRASIGDVGDIRRMAGKPDVQAEVAYRVQALRAAEIERQQRAILDEISSSASLDKAEALAAKMLNAEAQVPVRQMRGEAFTETRKYGQQVKVPNNWRLKRKWKAIAEDDKLRQQLEGVPTLDPVEQRIATKALRAADMKFADEMRRVLRADAKETPSWDQVRSRTQAVVNGLEDPDMRDAANAILRQWDSDTSRLLAQQAPRGQSVARALSTALTGEVADSYVAAIVHREGALVDGFRAAGFDEDVAHQIAKGMTEYQVRLKYGERLPVAVGNALESLNAEKGGAIAGAAAITQEVKNAQFGVADMALFGQQAWHGIRTAGPQFTMGLVNRLLLAAHMPAIDLAYADSGLPKRVAYALDGVRQGARTGMTDIDFGKSILSRIPTVGPAIDRPMMQLADRLTQFQFGTVLTNLRNMIYEGNLMMAKAAGADIADPAVRARAAVFANTATSAGELAQKGTRRQLEAATALSPSMRRAQIQQFNAVAKGIADIRNIKDPVKRTNAVLAAATMASWGLGTIALGKLITDYLNLEMPGSTFETDPSKQGYGLITLPNGKVYSVFPQEQWATTVAQSIRALAEVDIEEFRDEWIKFGLSSQSPMVQPFTRAIGYGYDPGGGWRLGDYGDGMSTRERIFNALPLPPTASEAIRDGINDSLATEFFGVPTFPESAASQVSRESRLPSGENYYDMLSQDPLAAKNFERDNPELFDKLVKEGVDSGAEWAIRAQETAKAREEFNAKQAILDANLARTGAAKVWRTRRNDNLAELYAVTDYINRDAPKDREIEARLQGYYNAIDAGHQPDGSWDAGPLTAYVDSLSAPDRAWVESRTGLAREESVTEQRYHAAVARISATSYWDIPDMVAVNKVLPMMQQAGLEVPANITSMYQLKEWVLEDAAAAVAGSGVSPTSQEGKVMIQRIMDSVFGDADALASDMRKKLRESDPQLMRDLIEWDYYNPSDAVGDKILSGSPTPSQATTLPTSSSFFN